MLTRIHAGEHGTQNVEHATLPTGGIAVVPTFAGSCAMTSMP
jgi:hypothetical protein